MLKFGSKYAWVGDDEYETVTVDRETQQVIFNDGFQKDEGSKKSSSPTDNVPRSALAVLKPGSLNEGRFSNQYKATIGMLLGALLEYRKPNNSRVQFIYCTSQVQTLDQIKK